MKRFFFTILLFISILKVGANPLPSPYAEISELQFRADGSWILEIVVHSYGMPIESIWIKSNSGESMINNFEDDDSHNKLFVVENDGLTTPLFINPLQDNVTVALCWYDYVDWDYTFPLTYGYPESNIRTPKIGQSIASIPYAFYSITKSPSIGLENDTTGMMGTIKGIIFDKDGLPLNINKDLNFHNSGYNIFYPNSDGSYSTRFYSNDFIDVWRLGYRDGDNVYRVVDIKPINFSMQPDSVVTRDIYLIGDIITGINEIHSNTESVFKIYPQPVKQQILNYEISIPIKSTETYLLFRNLNGQEIYKFLVKEDKGVVVLPENIKNGTYIVQLISNKKSYATNKLIVQ